MTVRTITDRIIEIRERRCKYSQTYMAEKLGMTQKAYSKIETGETKLTVQHLLQIVSILEIELSELFDLTSQNIYHNHHTHHGEGIVLNKNMSEDLKPMFEKLLQSKDREIEILRKYIDRLEDEVKQKRE